ncbi:hypothetical protein ACFE04_019622 [Oxalis oulophora]
MHARSSVNAGGVFERNQPQVMKVLENFEDLPCLELYIHLRFHSVSGKLHTAIGLSQLLMLLSGHSQYDDYDWLDEYHWRGDKTFYCIPDHCYQEDASASLFGPSVLGSPVLQFVILRKASEDDHSYQKEDLVGDKLYLLCGVFHQRSVSTSAGEKETLIAQHKAALSGDSAERELAPARHRMESLTHSP